MIIKFILNPQTLEITSKDDEVSINEINTLENGQIFIELSTADPDTVNLYGSTIYNDITEPHDPTGQ